MFKLKENGTKVSTEIIAGLTTFFTMAYIIIINPAILSQTGMEWGAVFIATIIASVVGTLIMGLVANVPYALAPGMGLNAMFTYTVCFTFDFTWQQALSMVFICGLLNILVTVTQLRKMLIKAIPLNLQNAISGGIGIFVAYIGIKNAGLLQFTADPGTYALFDDGTVITNSGIIPALVNFDNATVLLGVIGIALTFVLMILNVKGSIFISIVATTLIGIPLGVTQIAGDASAVTFTEAIKALPTTFGVIFTKEGLPSLFSDIPKLPIILLTVFAFSMSDIFDTIGTFIGTGRRSGIFSEKDEAEFGNSKGFKTKMDKALFADSIATSIGAIVGTSNTTTYVESAAGIGVGGRTGLTSVVTAAMFLISSFFARYISVIPSAATAPALIAVGVLMISSFKAVDWNDLEEAIPAFFAGIVMALCYSITYGIALGFIFYVIVKLAAKKVKEIHPVIWVTTALFVINFVINVYLGNL